MTKRQTIANFLQGLFVLPLCALFGLMVALLFAWHGGRLWACVAFCTLFPIAGALKTRQTALLAGLVAGMAAAAVLYLLLKPHA